MTRNDHDPDTNQQWRPLVADRIYRCDGCGTECTIQTNHTGKVWAEPCHGTCKEIFNPNTGRERVIWHPARPHSYVGEAR